MLQFRFCMDMHIRNYIFVLFQWMLWTSVAGENVCRCPMHILCLHPGISPGAECDGHIQSGLTSKEKMAILNATNSFRSRIAMGKEPLGKPGPQPTAADMMEVTWDEYLDITSQKWADRCVFEHSNTKCRVTGEDEYFGENLANTWYSHESMYHDGIFMKLIKSWEDEVKDFPRSLVDSYDPYSVREKIGHYAQIVNGKTYAIGCGRTRMKQLTYFVCHYKPGIYIHIPLYTRGEPASKCPKGSFASKYEGLCALEQYSGGTKNRHSAILIPPLFALVVMANKIQ